MKFYFSCDWGTTTFRLRLVDGENAAVLAEIKTVYGIASAFEEWKQVSHRNEHHFLFYQNYLLQQVKKLCLPFNDAFHNVPIVMSGMASSSIGMMELPYKELPFDCNGSGLVTQTIVGQTDEMHTLIIISGARSEDDVIRGEETMVAGCDISKDDTKQLFIFPGTHSKHLAIKNGLVEKITTYMTGELFELLSEKSILSSSVERSDPSSIGESHLFVAGVREAADSNLMNSIFHVRTNQLFGKADAAGNYQYLSGLLIGYELKGVAAGRHAAITLVCSKGLDKAYLRALDYLGLSSQVKYINADDALVKGQWKILRGMGYNGKKPG